MSVFTATAPPLLHERVIFFMRRFGALAIDGLSSYLPAYIALIYAASFLYGVDQPVGVLQAFPMAAVGIWGGDPSSVQSTSNLLYQHLGLWTGASAAAYIIVRLLIARPWSRPPSGAALRLGPAAGDRAWGIGLRIADTALRLTGLTLAGAAAVGLVWVFRHVENIPATSSDYLLVELTALAREIFVPLLLGFAASWIGAGQTIGRALMGLQVQTADGRPAGFVRLAARDGILRPLVLSLPLVLLLNLAALIPLAIIGVLLAPVLIRLRGVRPSAAELVSPLKTVLATFFGDASGRPIYDRWLGTRIVRCDEPPVNQSSSSPAHT